MTRVIFLDVDTQHDFMDPDGALPVPGARAIVPNLRRLTQAARARGVPIVASTDAHPADDPEFDEFGPHCVRGTPGQRKIDATLALAHDVARADALPAQVEALRTGRLEQLIVEKQTLDVFDVELTGDVLLRLDPARVCVYGVTTEYCVKAAVLGLRERGYAVSVVADAVEAIDEEAGRDALEAMQRVGAALSDTQAALAEVGAQ